MSVREQILGSGLISRIFQFESIDSTMQEARRIIEQQPRIAPNTLIISEEQKSGFGRFSRTWFSPKGGLYFSIVLQGKLDPSFTLIAGLSVAEAVEDFFNLETGLSWPNDVLMGGRKFAGILCETADDFTIVGTGINTFAPELLDESIRDEARAIQLLPQRKGKLLATIIMRFAANYHTFTKSGFAHFKASYEKHLVSLGKDATFTTGSDVFRGVLQGVNEKGALILDSGDKKHILYSAEATGHESKTKDRA
jgi:BirA family biotin operon repressor/biotin-[acetyl-CoA-carboxylase] ligase